MDGARVLGVFAHPDDESLAAAGLLARLARRGAEVRVICATRGEAGGRRDGLQCDARTLGELRWVELQRACQVLGLQSPVGLGLADGQLSNSDGCSRLGRELRARTPDLIVTSGQDGIYGHVDHLACTAWVSEARPPGTRVLHAAFPSGVFQPVWQTLRRVLPAAVIEQPPREGFGIERSSAHLCLVEVEQDRRAGLSAHASQLKHADPTTLMPKGVMQRILRQEWFRVAHGPALPPGGEDALAGI